MRAIAAKGRSYKRSCDLWERAVRAIAAKGRSYKRSCGLWERAVRAIAAKGRSYSDFRIAAKGRSCINISAPRASSWSRRLPWPD